MELAPPVVADALRPAIDQVLGQRSRALLTIGVVIALSSAMGLKNIDGEPLDLFGLGLTGRHGLTIYVMTLTVAAIAVRT